MDTEILKLLSNGITSGALIVLIYVVGMRLVSALEKLSSKVDQHRQDDLASHSDFGDRIASIEGAIMAMGHEDTQNGLRTPPFGTRPRRG